MKHDSLNLTAPHTLRELAQADTEAGAMHAKQIATMIAEDAYLDGQCAKTAQCPGEEISHSASASKALGAISVFEEISASGEAGNQAVQNLIKSAQALVDRWDSPLWGGSSLNLRHTGEFIADLRKALVALPAAQIGGAA